MEAPLATSTTATESQYVTARRGIPKERIVNFDKIEIIKELVKCSICLEILSKPYECEVCGSLFCEDCITDWLKINLSCPMKCPNFKLTKAKINTKKMLNLLVLRCSNYPECSFESEYWSMFEHENKCPFQKIKCPNVPCEFTGSYNDLKLHLTKKCPYLCYECGFCKSKIQRNQFEAHLDEHYKERTFTIANCSKCQSSTNLCRCLCKKSICYKCIQKSKNPECMKNCYLFHTGLKYTDVTYHISKYPLPKNFEAKLLFTSVDWVRTGICFNADIVKDQTDANCPQFDIYCILEDLVQFYTKNSGWKNCFPKGARPLKAGDYMTITLKNGEMRYAVNDQDLGSVIKIDMVQKKDMYLFVHTRNIKSRAEIVYICEILN